MRVIKDTRGDGDDLVRTLVKLLMAAGRAAFFFSVCVRESYRNGGRRQEQLGLCET